MFMRDDRVREIAVAALFTSMVIVLTYVIRIPISVTGGYFNFGDIVIFLAAMLMGGKYGFAAGGVGAAIADLIGFPSFALITFFVKGIEGFIVGYISRGRKHLVPSVPRLIAAALLGGLWMVAGYFIGEVIFFGAGASTVGESLLRGVKVAVIEVPWNILQAAVGIAASVPLASALFKVKLFNNID
jgi:uncharacterized membrane protein